MPLGGVLFFRTIGAADVTVTRGGSPTAPGSTVIRSAPSMARPEDSMIRRGLMRCRQRSLRQVALMLRPIRSLARAFAAA